jgi:4-hydroxy-tetrahydrodipicolinate reductase
MSLGEPLRLTISGACGRMGRELVEAAREERDLQLVSLWDHSEHPLMGRDPYALGLVVEAPWQGDVGDVIIDFSLEPGLAALLGSPRARPVPLVSGTTALTEATLGALAELSGKAPVFHASNMSTGVHILHRLAVLAAASLPSGWDVELVEMHHRRKVDAPSGTALSLAAAVRSSRPGELREVHGRSGSCGPRADDELGVLALRGGDVVGEHELIFAGPAETLRLSHSALSRAVFAVGALRAARWLAGQPAGLYGMENLR